MASAKPVLMVTVFCSAPAVTVTPAEADLATASALVEAAISAAVGADAVVGSTAQWNRPGSFSSTTSLNSVSLISVAFGNPVANEGAVSSAVVTSRSVTAVCRLGVAWSSSATTNTEYTVFSLRPVTSTSYAVSAAVSVISPLAKMVTAPYAEAYCASSCAGVGGVGLAPATT